MTTMTMTSCPAGEWTSVYSASGDADIGLANLSLSVAIKVRIDASATDEDAENAAHVRVEPRERASFAGLTTGDEVFVRPFGDDPAVVTVWA